MSTLSEPQAEGDESRSPPTYSEAVSEPADRNVAGNARVYDSIPENCSIKFRIFPFVGMYEKDQDWMGEMEVKCQEVPLLMREGFHWNAANIIREEGYFENTNPGIRAEFHRLFITRVWVLQDLLQPPRWTALLKVHARDYEIASSMRPETWTIDMIRCCTASSVLGKNIYFFDALNPRINRTSIYDDIPLAGWWPWPKDKSVDS